MPLCREDSSGSRIVCGPGGGIEIAASGLPEIVPLPDISRISSGVMGTETSMDSAVFLGALGDSIDAGVRRIGFHQSVSQGIPRAGGQFFEVIDLFDKPRLSNNPIFERSFVPVSLGANGKVAKAVDIFDKFGRSAAKVFGGALSRLTGDALKIGNVGGVNFSQMFNNVWDAIPMEAIPVLGAIIEGFIKVIADGIINSGSDAPRDTVQDAPTFNPGLDKAFADQLLFQVKAQSEDLTPIWSPPGPVLDDNDNTDRYRWNYGFDDIKMKDESGRIWWGMGSVNEGGFEPVKFAPYMNNPSHYVPGRDAPLAFGCIPGMAFVHTALTASKRAPKGYDLGRYLPTAGNVAGNLWFQAMSPTSPQIWRVWPDKLYDRWVKFLAAYRRSFHLTYYTSNFQSPRYRILSDADKKWKNWVYKEDLREKMVNAGAALFGWEKWGDKDRAIFNRCKGGKLPDKSLDYYIENFGILNTAPVRSIVDMKINQYGAAELVTCAYARPNSPALARNSELRQKIEDGKRKLLQSEKLHLVDEDMVDEPELRVAIIEAKKKLAQKSMKELWAAPNPDQVLEKEVRAARMNDMLLETTPISAAVTTQPTPLHAMDLTGAVKKKMPGRTKKKKRSTSSSGMGLAVAAATGAALMIKGKAK